MTRQEALTKIENYEKKLKVIEAPCHFEFAVRKVEEGEFIIVVEYVQAEEMDEVLVPSFVSYIDYKACCENDKGISDGYTLIFPKSCDISYGKPIYQKNFLRRTAGIVVQGGHASYTSENGVLFNKDKTCLCVYPTCKSDEAYTIPESVVCVEKNAFFMNEALEKLYVSKNVAEIQINRFNDGTWIEVDEENSGYKSEGGCLFSKDGELEYHRYSDTQPSSDLRTFILKGFREWGI